MSQGFSYMVVSAFFFSVMTTLVKFAASRVPIGEIVFARAAITLLLSWIALRHRKISMWGNQKTWLIARGFFGSCALYLYYESVAQLPLADATVIQYTNPIFTAILAALLLKESMGVAEILAIGISLVGVVLVARPAFVFGGVPLNGLAVTVALLGAFFSAVVYVIIRGLRGGDDPMVVVFYFPLVATPLALPITLLHPVWPRAFEWAILLGIGIATQIGQVFMTRGLYLVPAGAATSMSYLQVVFAYLWGVIIFAEYPTLTSIAGAMLVLASTILIARRAKVCA